jgi:thiol-disulfide isomerase/thioredoxin
MIRLASVIYFLLASVLCFGQTKIPSAEEVLNTASAEAAKENKNVLLLFHASWCGWCHAMDSSLQDAAVKPLIDKHYVITHLAVYESRLKKDLENHGALRFLTEHGGAEKGIPYWMVVGKNGNVLANSEYEPGKNTGCPASEKEVAFFISVLQKTSSLTAEELKIIEKRFRMNDGTSAATQ